MAPLRVAAFLAFEKEVVPIPLLPVTPLKPEKETSTER